MVKLVKAIKIIFLLLILEVLALNIACADCTNPIGEVEVELSSDTVSVGAPVTVTVKWWITDSRYSSYTGPFNISVRLEDSNGNPVSDWTTNFTVGQFNYTANESNPYTYTFTKNAPSKTGNYTLYVEVIATNINKCCNCCCKHLKLVGSEETTLTVVPEFSTIAIPAAILSILFVIRRRSK